MNLPLHVCTDHATCSWTTPQPPRCLQMAFKKDGQCHTLLLLPETIKLLQDHPLKSYQQLLCLPTCLDGSPAARVIACLPIIEAICRKHGHRGRIAHISMHRAYGRAPGVLCMLALLQRTRRCRATSAVS